MRKLLILLLPLMFCLPATAQTYSLPNNNSGCPSQCLQIPWSTGSDLWNGGVLPNYTSVTCTPLTENGTTDDTTNVNNCITAANAGTGSYATCHATLSCAVLIPAGTVFINGVVRLNSNVALRGVGPTTQIKLGASGNIDTQNFSWSTNINPGTAYATFPSTFTLTGTPIKGDTQVTIGSGTVSVGTWIKVFGNDDPSLIRANGTEGTYPPGDHCDWCADNTGYYVMQQMMQITSFASGTGGAGTVVNLSRPLYYTPDVTARTINGHSEPAGAKYNIITFPTQKAGIETMKIYTNADIGSNPIIRFQGCLYCWVKGVETQITGGNSESAHIMLMASYGAEIRDGYYHDQRSGASGTGYGVYIEWTNSDHKIENNILRHNRHAFVFQGGGSGTAFLFNYIDDNYTDDTTYMGSARTSHGAHPFMNLFEGNVASHITADDFWGTSSHDVLFRNWLWGDETENWTGAVAPTGTPVNGFTALDLYQGQLYYSYVGNVFGHTGLHTTWSAATLSATCTVNNCGYNAPATPGVYSYGSDHLGGIAGLATSSGTVLRHGNWDYKSNGVAFWDGGAVHALAASIYYAAQPAFLTGYAWPLEGPEGAPTINANPAENCWLSGPAVGGTFTPATCYAVATGGGSAPRGVVLTGVVR